MITTAEIETIRADFHRYVDEKMNQILEMLPKERDMQFLTDVNALVPLASEEPEQTPEIADLTGIEPIDEKQDWEPRAVPLSSDDERFYKLCTWVANGATKEMVSNFLISKSLAISESQEKHLQTLRKWPTLN